MSEYKFEVFQSVELDKDVPDNRSEFSYWEKYFDVTMSVRSRRQVGERNLYNLDLPDGGEIISVPEWRLKNH